MKKLICFLSMVFLLASCASVYKNDGDPEGKGAYVIECREATGRCFDKAKELFPKEISNFF